MKTRVHQNEKASGPVAFFFMLSLLLVLSAFATAYAGDKHTISIKNASSYLHCDVTVKYEDGSGVVKEAFYASPEEWKSKQCVTQISGKCCDVFCQYPATITNKICDDAKYEIKWVESAQQLQFLPY